MQKHSPAGRTRQRCNDGEALAAAADQECLTSILLNVRYPSSAGIGWNLVSLGTLGRGSLALQAGRTLLARSPMNAIPNNVTRFVQAHLQSLQELRQPFDSVFALERCSGALKATSGRLGLKTLSSAG
jgi:hypothetical protein